MSSHTSLPVLLDVDGVFCDFNAAAYQAHGKVPQTPQTWDYFKTWNPPLTPQEFWAPINAMDGQFYKTAPAYLWAYSLLKVIREFTSDLSILTANHPTPEGFAEKKRWCDENLPGIPVAVVDHKYNKSHFAGIPGSVLIDDRNENIEGFIKAGGRGILFPQPWNANHEFTDDRVGFVGRSLYELSPVPV